MASHHGIDVSTYQGDIDWTRVKASGIEFAMLRASFGSGTAEKQTDARFHKNAYQAAVAGLFIGAYHNTFAVTADDARREAELFLKIVDGYRLAYPVAVDIGDYLLRYLSPEQLSIVAGTWCEEVRKAGYYPMIFGKADTFKNQLTPKARETYEFWLAEPGDAAAYDGRFGMRQVSVREKIAGIRSFVNRDEAYQDYASIIFTGGYNGFQTAGQLPAEPPAQDQKPQAEPKPSKIARFIQLKELFDKSRTLFEEEAPDASLETVTVKDGDSLVGIASRYGMTGRELYRYADNRETIGVAPEKLKPDMVLRVPCKPKWPVPVLRVGAKVTYAGPVYRTSHGWALDDPISGTYTLTRIINGRKAGARLDSLGWVPLSDLRIVT